MRTVNHICLLGTCCGTLRVCKCYQHPPSSGECARPAHAASVLVTPPAAPHPYAERRAAPTLTIPAASSAGSQGHTRGWPPARAHTHHRAEHDSSVAVGLQVLLAEGLHDIRVRLQEELRELLANQVVAAVPQELASVVIGNQDLRVAGGGAGITSSTPDSQKWRRWHGHQPGRPRDPASPQPPVGRSQQCSPRDLLRLYCMEIRTD